MYPDDESKDKKNFQCVESCSTGHSNGYRCFKSFEEKMFIQGNCNLQSLDANSYWSNWGTIIVLIAALGVIACILIIIYYIYQKYFKKSSQRSSSNEDLEASESLLSDPTVDEEIREDSPVKPDEVDSSKKQDEGLTEIVVHQQGQNELRDKKEEFEHLVVVHKDYPLQFLDTTKAIELKNAIITANNESSIKQFISTSITNNVILIMNPNSENVSSWLYNEIKIHKNDFIIFKASDAEIEIVIEFSECEDDSKIINNISMHNHNPINEWIKRPNTDGTENCYALKFKIDPTSMRMFVENKLYVKYSKDVNLKIKKVFLGKKCIFENLDPIIAKIDDNKLNEIIGRKYEMASDSNSLHQASNDDKVLSEINNNSTAHAVDIAIVPLAYPDEFYTDDELEDIRNVIERSDENSPSKYSHIICEAGCILVKGVKDNVVLQWFCDVITKANKVGLKGVKVINIDDRYINVNYESDMRTSVPNISKIMFKWSKIESSHWIDDDNSQMRVSAEAMKFLNDQRLKIINSENDGKNKETLTFSVTRKAINSLAKGPEGVKLKMQYFESKLNNRTIVKFSETSLQSSDKQLEQLSLMK